MSNVLSIQIQATEPGGITAPNKTVYSVGTSSVGYVFTGVIRNQLSQCIAVFQAGTQMSRSLSQVNTQRDGVVFISGSDGNWCLVTIDTTDLNDWTVRLRTDKDKAGTGTTFVAGTGGGGR